MCALRCRWALVLRSRDVPHAAVSVVETSATRGKTGDTNQARKVFAMNTGTIADRLPPAHSDSYAWQQRGACRTAEGALVMFSDDHDNRGTALERERRAKRLCDRCPVVTECLDHALHVGEPYGVWGGLAARERRALLGAPRVS